MTLANSIKALAKEHGMTITQLAESMGVLQPQLSRTINNPRISVEDLCKLAEVIGCNVGDFFSDGKASEQPHIVCPKCGEVIPIETTVKETT